jgi:hypothetical protein
MGTAGGLAAAVGAEGVLFAFEQGVDYFLLLVVGQHLIKLS